MKRHTFNYRQAGIPSTGDDMYAFAQERYRDLLREAEEYRQEPRGRRPRLPSSVQSALRAVRHLLLA